MGGCVGLWKLIAVGTLTMMPAALHAEEPLASLRAASVDTVTMRVDAGTGFVTLVRGRFVPPQGVAADREAAARAFLAEHRGVFGVEADPRSLELRSRTEGAGGTVLVFEQSHEGVPVFGSAVVVAFDQSGDMVHVRIDALPGVDLETVPRISRSEAAARAGASLGTSFADDGDVVRLVVVEGGKSTPGPHLAWEVRGFRREPLGDWHVFVQAATGEVVRTIDMLKRAGAPCVPCNPLADFQCGRVFHKNPVDFFGDPALTDLSNVDGAQTGCRLFDLTSTSFLDGAWANTGQTAARVGPPYNSMRSVNQNGVDEVNVYYHAERAKQYLVSLGFPDVMNFSIGIDAHDSALGDNSHYVPSTKILEFGTGGVDDAQDMDIVYHEFGHAIQDNQVPNFGQTDEGGAAGEGFGDYWAAAITDDAFIPQLGLECVGAWNATFFNPYNGTPGTGCMRRLDSAKQYPRDMGFEVHDDGEIWSAALWRLRNAVSGPVADSLVIQSHALLTPVSDFIDHADALLTADQMLHGGVHTAAIHQAMKLGGLPRSGLAAPPNDLTAFVPFLCETDHPYLNLQYKECRFTQPGAQRIRFHFSSFSTEPFFDVVHVSDADYFEVQGLSGVPFPPGGGWSAAVEGDTIVARFKADGSLTQPGFVIDAVEYAPASAAGSVPDGNDVPGPPFTIQRIQPGMLELAWGGSCAPAGDDYEIYEGILGSFTSHVPFQCSTGGATTLSMPIPAGDRYFLVVPRTATHEGSYGTRSDGTEIPASGAACLPQSPAENCP